MRHTSLYAFVLLTGCTRSLITTGDGADTGTGGGVVDTSTIVTSATTPGPMPTTAPATSSGTGDSSGDGIDFIIDNDMQGGFECSIWVQDCPPGEKCMPWANDGGNSWNARKCSPLDPNPVDVGEECTVEGSAVSGVDNCGPTSMCFYVDPLTNIGECVPFCTGDESNPMCEDPGRICPLSGDGVLAICLETCHPLNGDCAPDRVCVPYSDNFLCTLLAGGSQYGDECEFLNACADGLFCANSSSVPGCDPGFQGCCAPFCDLTQDPALQCPQFPEEQCVPWYDPPEAAPPPLANLGACIIPPP